MGPGVLADVPRALVMALGGVAFAMALSEAYLYYSRKRDPRDPWYGVKRLDYLVLVRLGIAVAVLGMAAVIGTKLGHGQLTFRVPLVLVAYTLLIWGMGGILADDEKIKDSAAGERRRSTDQRS